MRGPAFDHMMSMRIPGRIPRSGSRDNFDPKGVFASWFNA